MFARISDDDAERLLGGGVPADRTDLEPLARFLDRAQAAFPEPAVDAREAEHVTAMVAAAHESADVLVSNPPPDAQTRKDTQMSRKPLLSKRARIAAIAVAVALFALVGTAFAGVLPAPIQSAVSGAADTVGISLPTGDQSPSAPEAVDQDDQGDVDEDALEAPEAPEVEDEADEPDEVETDDDADEQKATAPAAQSSDNEVDEPDESAAPRSGGGSGGGSGEADD